MIYLILGSILLLRVVQSITSKSCSNLLPATPGEMIGYMSVRMGLSAIAALIMLLLTEDMIGGLRSMPLLGWLLALSTGITLTVASLISLIVMKKAVIVLVSLFGTAGLLVPTVSGIFLYGQAVKIGQWAGIGLLFVATLFLSAQSKSTNGKLEIKTILLLIGYMISNGGTMLLQTLYKNYVPTGSVSIYSFLQFAIPSIILLILASLWSVKEKKPMPHIEKRLMGYTVFAAAALFGISQISTIASAMVPVAVLFPISDGGGMIISAAVAAIMFKEKLTIKSVCGIIVGILGIILIKLAA